MHFGPDFVDCFLLAANRFGPSDQLSDAIDWQIPAIHHVFSDAFCNSYRTPVEHPLPYPNPGRENAPLGPRCFH